MNKKFYTYEEIFLALHEEYIKNQELLNKLKRYVYIENQTWVESTSFKPIFQQKNNDHRMTYPLQEKSLMFEVLESMSFIRQSFEELFGVSYNRLINYKIKQDDQKHYYLKEQTRGHLVWFEPKITIADQQIFDSLSEEILNSDFMNLQNEAFYPMFGYRLRVLPEQLFLGNSEHWISYSPKDDTIEIKKIKDHQHLYYLLREAIPECYVNERVKALVNKNLLSDKQIELEEQEYKKDTKLSVANTTKGVKIRKLKK